MNKVKLLSLTKNDFEFQPFRGTGNGGQNRNKVETCIRITHKASGCTTTACEHRTQGANKRLAFEKLCKDKKFLSWLRLESLRKNQLIDSEEEIQRKVDLMMQPNKLKIEVYNKETKKYEEEFIEN